MVTKVQKWGNSLGLRIPKAFAEEVRIEEGTAVDLSVSDGQLIFRPIQQRSYELADLLVEVTDENLHTEIATGEPRRRESRAE